MKHILALAFTYNRYKRDAVIRIHSGENLVAEIILSDSIKIKTAKIFQYPEKLFFIEIEEKYLGKSITIQVENDNNNYSNGFMTKYSWIMFHRINLLPDCLLQEKNWKRLYRFQKMDRSRLSQSYRQLLNRQSYPPYFTKEFLVSGKEHWPDDILMCRRGGNFTMEMTVSRKYGIWHIGKVRPGRIYLQEEGLQFWSSYHRLNTPA
jgi:hypothetical protein